MTLEQAVAHAKEVAASKCDECGKEHQELAEWLSELNGYKDKTYIEPDFLTRNGFEKPSIRLSLLRRRGRDFSAMYRRRDGYLAYLCRIP